MPIEWDAGLAPAIELLNPVAFFDLGDVERSLGVAPDSVGLEDLARYPLPAGEALDDLIVRIEDGDAGAKLGHVHVPVSVHPGVIRTVEAGLLLDELAVRGEDLDPVILSIGDPEASPSTALVEPDVMNEAE